MAISRWDPFRELTALQKEVDRLFEDSVLRRGRQEEFNWLPPVDVKEEEGEIVLFVDLPGVEEKEIDITVSGDQLTIKGERKFPGDESKFIRRERAFGPFSRSFALSVPVEVDQVKASYKNGVLEVHLPKSGIARPKKVEVKTE
ncbi:MAG: hypothetical protein PWP04_1855 [Candidatus Atribacteria bacterium]|nr:hypothetical protein [Candidatus Atribacteria bacterium]